ncbi:MAG: type II toxin-antitoxin system VapC family toxin [Acidobacteria bacterium]|nr:type II toxin-antitoxin system VapC family toxin [Acidobacteriota bacterium]
MKAVVDTNVVAYFLLGTEPFKSECEAFWRAVESPAAPASWEAEVTNVLWQACRHGVMGVPAAVDRLRLAQGLGIRSVPVRGLWQGALVRACDSGLAAYDSLFVELACREQVPLATFDREILRAFPDLALRPAEVSAG